MRTNRGITLASLIIYIIALMIFVGTMATITKYFYKNFKEISINDRVTKEYTELTKFITEDTNSKKIENTFISDKTNEENGTIEGHQIVFKLKDLTTHRYTFKENTIYYSEIQDNTATKNIPLCNNVNTCTFTLNQNILTVSIEFEGGNTYTTAYTIQK